MGEEQKLRDRQLRLTKLRDDTFNRTQEIDKVDFKQSARRTEKEAAATVPFYERLRHHSEAFDKKLRLKDREQKELSAYKAGHIDGVCLIDPGRIDVYLK